MRKRIRPTYIGALEWIIQNTEKGHTDRSVCIALTAFMWGKTGPQVSQDVVIHESLTNDPPAAPAPEQP